MDPGSGNLVTFAQFAFIALEGFISTAKFGTEPLKIPYQSYILLVVMFFFASVANNYAFDFNIPMPLHMIFRAVSSENKFTFSWNLTLCEWIFLIWFFSRNLSNLIGNGLLKLQQLIDCFPFQIVGLVDRKHGYGNHYSTQAIRFFQIFICSDDNTWNSHLYNCLWKQCCE